jgi:hypothetical protein
MSEALSINNHIRKIEGKVKPDYPREFFGLQINFARKVAQVSGVPLSQVLLEYTNFYRRFNLGRKPDENNPIWHEFIASIDEKNIIERVYELYQKRKDIKLEKGPNKKEFGCFTFEYKPEEKCVRIHFDNKEENGSSLDDINLEKRRGELKSMFEYAKNNYPKARVVRGNSWLYNLPKYRRFFPSEYTRDPKPVRLRFVNLSGWGQFLDKDMKIKSEALNIFQEKLTKAQSLDQVLDSLPLRTLEVETKIEDFYNFYDIR